MGWESDAVESSPVGGALGAVARYKVRISGDCLLGGATEGCVAVATPSLGTSLDRFSDRVARNLSRDLIPAMRAFASVMSCE